jgi:threonine dehydrogenase-like Zn-dependent dehydrogenase
VSNASTKNLYHTPVSRERTAVRPSNRLTVLTAQFARVPWADSSLVKIPHGLDDKEWLPLADAWPTGWSGLDWSGFEPGDTVAVFGAGGIGLMAAYSAIIRGASLVYVVDYKPERLAKAAAMGAVPINFTRGGSASQQILRLRPKGVKRAVDAVGMAALNAELKLQQDYVIQEAIAVTRGLGGIGVAGSYPAETPTNPAPGFENVGPFIRFPIGLLHMKELRVQSGIVRYYDIIPALVELVRNGRARPGFIFSDEMKLEDAVRAYRRFEAREGVKILLDPGTRGDSWTVSERPASVSSHQRLFHDICADFNEVHSSSRNRTASMVFEESGSSTHVSADSWPNFLSFTLCAADM